MRQIVKIKNSNAELSKVTSVFSLEDTILVRKGTDNTLRTYYLNQYKEEIKNKYK